MRRLPVYILLDTSESMIGDAINSVQTGLETLLDSLRSDPHALETAWVSIITFDADAKQIVPLTELIELQTPQLSVRPGTCLGKALSLLRNCMEGEVKKTTSDQRGDFRPLVFLLTDGQATDEWHSVKEAVDRLATPRIANFYAIGCGDDVDYGILQELSDAMFKLADMTPETMRKLFIWLTASVRSASVGATTEEQYGGIDLSKKPEEVDQVPRGEYERYSGLPLQVFLKGYCLTQKLPYLMRFRLESYSSTYDPVMAHKLEPNSQVDRSFDVPTVQASQLRGIPACPYCGNTKVLFCDCGAMICLPDHPPRSIECPKCRMTGEIGDVSGDFDISTSAG